MRSVYEAKVAETTETERHLRQGTAKIASSKFGAHAKLAWPFKTAAELAVIAGTNERTAARWLSGEFEPPVSVVLALVNKIFER